MMKAIVCLFLKDFLLHVGVCLLTNHVCLCVSVLKSLLLGTCAYE